MKVGEIWKVGGFMGDPQIVGSDGANVEMTSGLPDAGVLCLFVFPVHDPGIDANLEGVIVP